MNIIQKFRTSFSGFNRGDVADYIERTAHAHTEETASLRQALKEAQEKQAQAEAERDEIKAILKKFTEAYDAAKAAIEE